MNSVEQECRRIAKEKGMTVRNYNGNISVNYTVTITRQGRIFHSWDDALDFISKYKS